MAKKQNGSAKKSAIPYTPEVVPQAQQAEAAPAAPKATRGGKAKSTLKASSARPAVTPVMAEVPAAAATTPQTVATIDTTTEPAVNTQAVETAGAAVITPEADSSLTEPSIPESTTGGRRAVTSEMIAERAYYIAISGTGGSEDDNWLRAEAELKREHGL